MERYELVIRFLEEMGAAREAQMYLRLFHKGEPHRFAVIEVAEDLAEFSLHQLALNLAFLSSLDLYPVVVHGAGQPVAAREEGPSRARKVQADMWQWLAGRGETERPEAARSAWQAARDATLALNETLTSAVILHGGNATGLESGVFTAGEDAEAPRPRLSPIRRAIRNDQIPIVAAAALKDRTLVPLPLRSATEALIRRLKPRKIIRLSAGGGLVTADGSLVDYVNLRLDGDRLLASGALEPGSAAELARYLEILADLPPRTVIEVSSAAKLLRELFTAKGGGTLVKLGRDLAVHAGVDDLSRTRLRRLIERSFGRKLKRDYFISRFSRRHPIRTVIVDPDYKGMAIVRDLEGLDYLDKFAVRPEARGEGIAADLWSILAARHPDFFWRSRPANPINPWYYERADGVVKLPDWLVWWRGLSLRDAQRAVALAREIPPTLG